MSLSCNETPVSAQSLIATSDWLGRLSRLWTGFLARRATARQNRENRAAFAHLLTLDDATLDDIGTNRVDVLWAFDLPITQNAALELNNRNERHRTSINKGK